MDSSYIAPIFFLVFTVGIATFLALLVGRRAKSMRAAIDAIAGGTGLTLKAGKKIQALHKGVGYEYEYTRGSKNTPPSFRVRISCSSQGDFRVTRESGFDRFSKKTGIAREVQTGDTEFDSTFYISTNAHDFASHYFLSPRKRSAIGEIFRTGFTSVRHDGKVMEALWSPFRQKESLTEDLLTDVVSRLMVLAGDIPAVGSIPGMPGEGPWKLKRAIAFAVPILLEITGITALLFGLTHNPPLDLVKTLLDSLKYSLPALILFSWLAVVLVRGRGSSHRELIIILIISLTAFPLAGAGLEVFLNGRLDESDPYDNTVVVLDKYVSRSDKSTSYYVILESWRTERATEKLKVSPHEYGSIKPRTTRMTVTTKPGRFGFEWVVSRRIEMQPPIKRGKR